MSEPPAKRAGYLRFVVISDTHGWKLTLAGRAEELACADEAGGHIFLPKGDILLHCGDMLNEGVPITRNSSYTSDVSASPALPDSKLVQVLQQFASMSMKRTAQGVPIDGDDNHDKYAWVFFVGGNHDAPFQMLAANGELAPMLGDSTILLQSFAELDNPSPLDTDLPTAVRSAAKNMCTQSNIINGAVRIRRDCTLCPPLSHTDDGVVLAGSGLSLANNAWSANRAFQIQRSESGKLAHAAEQLVARRPDIVMTHGPPKGYADEKKGDQFLRDAIDGSSTKLHFFGHAHTNGMGKDDHAWELHGEAFPGRCFVNASMVTSLYLPTRLPIVVDIPVGAESQNGMSRWSGDLSEGRVLL